MICLLVLASVFLLPPFPLPLPPLSLHIRRQALTYAKPMRQALFTHHHRRTTALSTPQFHDLLTGLIRNPMIILPKVEQQSPPPPSSPILITNTPDVGIPAVSGDSLHLLAREREALGEHVRMLQHLRGRGGGAGRVPCHHSDKAAYGGRGQEP